MSEGEKAPGQPEAAQNTAADERRGLWMVLGGSLLAAVAVLVGLHLVVGVKIDAPTLALALACALLIWALRGMWGVVTALARPSVDALIDDGVAARESSTLAELREEKRRVLRAIKELEFDHSMGKLSDEDFAAIGDRYKLRAIEIMRTLDEGGEVHPVLREHLRLLEESEAKA